MSTVFVPLLNFVNVFMAMKGLVVIYRLVCRLVTMEFQFYLMFANVMKDIKGGFAIYLYVNRVVVHMDTVLLLIHVNATSGGKVAIHCHSVI